MRQSLPRASPPNAGLRAGLLAGCGACALALGGLAPVTALAVPDASPKTFDIEAYDVDGAKILAAVDIERAVYPFLGPDRTSADVGRARDALEKAYRDRGYQSVVVEIPAQSVSDGIVRLHVVEAPVGRLRVTGSRYFSPEVIKHEASAFQEGQVPNITTAQSEMKELNRLPDRRVTPLLRAGEAPGTVDVDLKVTDTLPLHGSLELSNDHNQFTEPLRLSGTLHYDDLWQLGHSASFTYAVAPENRDESEIFAGSYLAPLWNTPVSLLAYGYDSNSNVATVGGTTVLGRGYAVGLRSIVQLPSHGDMSHSVSFGIDFKHFNESFSSIPNNVQYWPLNVTYNIQIDNPKISTKASVALTAGVRGMGSSTEVFQNSRFDAGANFIHLNVDLTETEELGAGFEAAERFTGQLADQPLVSSEEFAAGGFNSVRGYLQSEATGDDGVAGSLELRSPSERLGFDKVVDELRLYVFADGATIWVLDPLPEQTRLYHLVSAGMGLRFALLKHLKGDVAVGVPFIAGVATHADRPRATFSIKSEF
jgi:hemolysin activation/secretion protein